MSTIETIVRSINRDLTPQFEERLPAAGACPGPCHRPAHAANDDRADNVLLQVQYGEVEGELVGLGIVTALTLINNLEINEQVLYARMINIEESTVIL